MHISISTSILHTELHYLLGRNRRNLTYMYVTGGQQTPKPKKKGICGGGENNSL